jgi:hypothetical protein
LVIYGFWGMGKFSCYFYCFKEYFLNNINIEKIIIFLVIYGFGEWGNLVVIFTVLRSIF